MQKVQDEKKLAKWLQNEKNNISYYEDEKH